ncbi:hypothetical protein BV22DRAFT_749866 [Leucogyrophana mollusca]|uniref:Uncharacterized protein n=1 Tax=Leucogyrophana mollusca TaxID=85980 RepID=A0ACB8B7I2_9AGAM|nr:hypothetical protein BV22DRAFT_749866 [Leucogyrophana mollusca]
MSTVGSHEGSLPSFRSSCHISSVRALLFRGYLTLSSKMPLHILTYQTVWSVSGYRTFHVELLLLTSTEVPPEIRWAKSSLEVVVHRLRALSLDKLGVCIRGLPPSSRPAYHGRSRLKTCAGLTEHLLLRVSYLLVAGSGALADVYLSLFPYHPPAGLSNAQCLVQILVREYGTDVMDQLSSTTLSTVEKKRAARREEKLKRITDVRDHVDAIDRAWPSPVSSDVTLSCLARYVEGTKWTPPPMTTRSTCTFSG